VVAARGRGFVSSYRYLLRWPVTETFIESINTEIVALRTRSKEDTFDSKRDHTFYARSINAVAGGLQRAELHSRYYLQSRDSLTRREAMFEDE
jgi:phage terminase Nu1 subunit (DNA packaging protein)